MGRSMTDHDPRASESAASLDPRSLGRGARSLWRSWQVWLALVLTALGAGLWMQRSFAASTPAVTAPATGERAPSLTDAGTGATGAASAPDAGPAPGAPMPFRLGLGFIGGCAIGWALRTFLRITLVIATLVGAAIALLRWSGLVELDWGSVEQSVDAGLQQARAAAEAAESTLMRIIPSGLAATYGMWIGWRRA
jgi:uncharacterized membrane protein (Fun14 family)